MPVLPPSAGAAEASRAAVDQGVVLAADVGGTHLRLGLFLPQGLPHAPPLLERVWGTGEASSLQAALEAFLALGSARLPGLRVRWAGFGLPGQLLNAATGVPALNLPWRVDALALEGWLRATLPLERVALLNDFVALACAAPHFSAEALHPLEAADGGASAGQKPGRGPDAQLRSEAPLALLGAGTGLGAALILPAGGGWRCLPSQLGSCDFAPRGAKEDALLAWLRRRGLARGGCVSWEHVLSGAGLVRLHRFLVEVQGLPLPSALEARLGRGDPSAAVVECAVAGCDAGCVEAAQWFCRLYGMAAADWALRVVPWRGVLLGGGLAPRLLRLLEQGGFREAFEAHPHLGELLCGIPTHVIVHPRPGLAGAAMAALQEEA